MALAGELSCPFGIIIIIIMKIIALQPLLRRLQDGKNNSSSKSSSKSLPDLTGRHDDLLEELKMVTRKINPSENKSFSSRFVVHEKPKETFVVRRKKSGLVDDHFEAIVEPSPPPCNCPRHFAPAKNVDSNNNFNVTSRHRLTKDADFRGTNTSLIGTLLTTRFWEGQPFFFVMSHA